MGYLGNQPTAVPIQSSDLADGIVTNAKLGTDISAAKLTAGTLADARFPATLPALNGSNLTNISGGKVVQLQHTKDTGYHAVNSVSFVTVLEVTITPTSSSNSILVIGSPHIGKNTNDTMVIERVFRVVGGSDVTNLGISDISGKNGGTAQNMIGGSSFQWYDSPNTTSAVTYQYRIASYSDNNVVFFNLYNAGGSYSSQITAMEISA